MKIVMVHGRSQQHKDPVELEKSWRDALTYGLARADAQLADGTEFAFPYYGDELDELVRQVDAQLTAAVGFRGDPAEGDQALRGEILAEIGANVGLMPRDYEREVDGVVIEKGPQNWEWVQAILRAVDRIPGLNAEAIDTFTRDVYIYLSYPAVRAKIDAIVAAALPVEPFIVLAHSLGTVVTYNILRKHAVDPKCLRLVTVGCPLGIRAIQTRVERPLESPSCVVSWFNAYDDRDVVALRPLDARNFPVRPPIENKSDVSNFTENRHGIAGYLADPVVASKLADATRGL